MKYIIIGLGNFGSTLSTSLTGMGHEVIGVDKDMNKVNGLKDKITHAVCVDSTSYESINTLPLQDADAVIVGIGEDFGASVMTTALLKQLKVKRLISRSMSELHHTVIDAIGVDQIISPEEESALRLAKKIQIEGVVDSFELSDHYSIIEAKVPDEYVGKTIQEIDFTGRYGVNILTIIKMREVTNLFGKPKTKPEVVGLLEPNTRLAQNDIMVLFGQQENIRECLLE